MIHSQLALRSAYMVKHFPYEGSRIIIVNDLLSLQDYSQLLLLPALYSSTFIEKIPDLYLRFPPQKIHIR